VISSVLSVAGKKNERDRKTHLINLWLRADTISGILVFFDRGEVYMTPGLLGTDKVQLSRRG